jgi:hypothetical protein
MGLEPFFASLSTHGQRRTCSASDDRPTPAETEAKGQSTRKPLPDHLPREDVVLSPGEACEQCGGVLRHLGEDVSEPLEYVPGRFKVMRTVRPKLSCRCCESCKRRTDQTPRQDVNQLLGTLGDGEFGLYVNLGSYSRGTVEFERNRAKLRLINGEQFVELLLENYAKLAPRYRSLIPLKQIYVANLKKPDAAQSKCQLFHRLHEHSKGGLRGGLKIQNKHIPLN